MSEEFEKDLDFAWLLRGDAVEFEAIEAWYGHIASETLAAMEEIVGRYAEKLDVVLENDAFPLANFSSPGDDVIVADVSQDFLDGAGGNDTFVLDGLQNHKYIYDNVGNNSIQVNGKTLGGASLVIDGSGTDFTFKDEDGNTYTKYVSANGTNYDLLINLKSGGSVTIIHWDQSPGLFGISLNGIESEDEYQIPEQSNNRFIVGEGKVRGEDGKVQTGWFKNDHGELEEEDIYLRAKFDGREGTKNWTDELGKSLDQSHFNERKLEIDAQKLIGSSSGDVYFEGGNLKDSFVGNNGSNNFYALDGDDYFEGTGGKNRLVGGEGSDYFVASDNGDHIFMEDEDSLDAGGSGQKDKKLGVKKLRPFFSMVDQRKKLHRELVETRHELFDTMLDVTIPYASVIERMGEEGLPLEVLAPNSPAAENFRQMWKCVQKDLWGRGRR